MGGLGSGEYSKWRCLTVEEVSCLCARDLSQTTWRSNSGRVYSLCIYREGHRAGWIVLKSTNDQNQFQHTLWLEYTAQPLGGDRAWLQCPACQKKKGRLYLLNGHFKCRCCHGLSYKSRQLSVEKRNLQQAQKAYTRLTDEPFSWWEPLPGRPKFMHQKKYIQCTQKILYFKKLFFESLNANLSFEVNRFIGPTKKYPHR